MIQLRQFEDKDFLNKFDFENKYYLEILFKKLKNFLSHIPIPYYIDFDYDNNVFIFRVGENKKNFEVNSNIYYTDFLTQIKKWVFQFYPQYYVDDQYGIILKIFFKTNEFSFFNNGIKELRYVGKKNCLLSLSNFLKRVRTIEDKKELKDFIIENSTMIETLSSLKKDIYVEYLYEMMKNFFIINFDVLKTHIIEKQSSLHYRIGNYIIIFCDALSEQECLEYLRNRQ
jgi:hypothetical protein